jgi:cytochrome c5
MRIVSIGALLLAACGGTPSAATSPAAPAPAVEATTEPASPVASAVDAATRGATLYGASCASCHGDAGQGLKAPPVVGKDALPLDPRAGSNRQVQFRTALDVYNYVKVSMPGDAPGSLQDDEYRAIVAFDLKANGVDLTGKDISDETLAAIVLH